MSVIIQSNFADWSWVCTSRVLLFFSFLLTSDYIPFNKPQVHKSDIKFEPIGIYPVLSWQPTLKSLHCQSVTSSVLYLIKPFLFKNHWIHLLCPFHFIIFLWHSDINFIALWSPPNYIFFPLLHCWNYFWVKIFNFILKRRIPEKYN